MPPDCLELCRLPYSLGPVFDLGHIISSDHDLGKMIMAVNMAYVCQIRG